MGRLFVAAHLVSRISSIAVRKRLEFEYNVGSAFQARHKYLETHRLSHCALISKFELLPNFSPSVTHHRSQNCLFNAAFSVSSTRYYLIQSLHRKPFPRKRSASPAAAGLSPGGCAPTRPSDPSANPSPHKLLISSHHVWSILRFGMRQSSKHLFHFSRYSFVRCLA